VSTSLRLEASTAPAAPRRHGMIGEHPAMLQLYDDIQHAAPLNVPIVIQGPTGAGKELVAQALHALSGRRGAIIPVNVGAIPDAIAESELFGVVQGAYTGASRSRGGLIDAAEGGTLYLDEAAELSPTTQVRLLRVMETGAVRPVGSSQDHYVSLRLVLSIQCPADQLLDSSRWRRDFYYRAAGVVLVVPSLIERGSDIGLLVNHWLAGLGHAPLDPECTTEILGVYEWPGNVRELRRAVERAVFTARDGLTSPQGILRAAIAVNAPMRIEREPSTRSLEDVNRRHIEAVLVAAHFNTRAAAAVLGLSVSQLYRRFQALGIKPPRSR
jgi:DNA-binding NtrC family response regulator